MKVAVLDIETTNLNADVGFILCCCYKIIGEKKMYTTRIDDSPGYRKKLYDDTKCVKDIYGWLDRDDPDFVVIYNGKNFDVPYLETRLLNIKINGMRGRALPKFRVIDHYRTSRFKLRLHSNSMDSLAKYLKLPVQKTCFDLEVWKKAMFGDKASLNKIVYHCKKDILVLEQIHNIVKPQLRSLKGE